MSFIEWTNEWELNIPEIDRQHKRIVDYINDLHHAIKYKDMEQVLSIADRVIDYTYEHFEYEEGVLKKANYVMLDDHLETHERFKNQALKMKSRLMDDSNFAESKKMRSELTLWLFNHIQREDSKYVQYVSKPSRWKALFGLK